MNRQQQRRVTKPKASTKTTKSSQLKKATKSVSKRTIKTQKKQRTSTSQQQQQQQQQSPSLPALSPHQLQQRTFIPSFTQSSNTTMTTRASSRLKSNPLLKTKHSFFSTTTTTTDQTVVPSATGADVKPQYKLCLRQVLKDLEYESLIPAIQTPPQLQSLLLDQSTNTKEQNDDGSLQLYHLVLLSTGDFRTVFPNDLQRNRLKEHIRNILGGPLLVSDGTEPMSRDSYNQLLNVFYERQQQHLEAAPVTPEPTPVPTSTTDQTTTTTTQTTTKPSTPVHTEQTDPAPPTDTATAPTMEETAAQFAAATPPQDATAPATEVEADKALAKEMLKISFAPLRMPHFFEVMKTGSIQQWHVKVGEHFVRGQLLCDIDTDIAELSFEAPEPGHLSEILVQNGESIAVGEAIAIFRYQEDTLVKQ